MSGFGPVAEKDAEYHRHRVRLARVALHAYGRALDDGPWNETDVLFDLLTDLRHFCDWVDLDFDERNEAASLHHAIEVAD